jgi:hypothetical protein
MILSPLVVRPEVETSSPQYTDGLQAAPGNSSGSSGDAAFSTKNLVEPTAPQRIPKYLIR